MSPADSLEFILATLNWAVFVEVAASTLNIMLADVPPPGVGFSTVTGKWPTVERSAVEMVVVTLVASTKVVGRAEPFHRTLAPLTKLNPLTVKVNPISPTTAEVLESDVRPGTGLLMEKLCTFEVPPPGAGLNTVTEAVPDVVMSAAFICAVSCVAFTNVVARSAPFQRTFESTVKLDPPTVSVNALPPADALPGVRLLSTGTGFVLVIVKLRAGEVPPPGDGLTTVTGTLPDVATSAAVI